MSTKERTEAIRQLDEVFAVDGGPYNRFPSVSHILGSDWGCSVMPSGPNNSAHYRDCAYRFVDLRWPA